MKNKTIVTIELTTGPDSNEASQKIHDKVREALSDYGVQNTFIRKEELEAKPKPGEVYRTQAGRLALIVAGNIAGQNKLLWFDDIDNELTVGEIYNRLDYKVGLTPVQFMVEVMAGAE